jgi:hypothetical protein
MEKNKKKERAMSVSSLVLLRNFLFIAFAFAFLLPSVSAAGFTLQGDLPNSPNSTEVMVYNGTQIGNPCSGLADAGTALWASTGWNAGNTNYDNNDDYTATNDTLNSSTTMYIYFCRAPGNLGDLLVSFNHTINPGDNIELDFGYVVGTASTNNELNSTYIHVCDALTNGTELSSINAQADGTTAAYSQYYYMWEPLNQTSGGNLNNIYIYFDADTSNKCTFDNTKKAGLHVLGNSASSAYGVYVDYAPATEATGAIHSDIATAGYLKLNSSIANYEVVGMTGQLTASPYALYYKNPGGAMTMYVYTAASTNVKETITGLANGFTSQKLDTKINGSVPSDITEVLMNISGIVYNVSASGTYAIYVPSDADVQSLKFLRSGVTVFSYDVNTSVGDQEFDIAKISGDAHSDLNLGTVEVYADDACTTPATGFAEYYPTGASVGTTYEAYFVDLPLGFYLSFTDIAGYNTCGNRFTLSSQEATVNVTAEVRGTVPVSINASGTVVVDKDKNTAYDDSDAFTQTFVGQTYRVYSTTGDYAVDFYSDNAVPPTALELTLGKTLAEGNLTVDVAAVNWTAANIHADINTTAELEVWSDDQATQLSSESRNFSVDDTQYYELPTGGIVDFIVNDPATLFYVNDFTETAGDTQLFEPNTKINFTVPSTITGAELIGTTFNYRDDSTAGGNPYYVIYIDKTESTGGVLYTDNIYTDGPPDPFDTLELSRNSTYTNGSDSNFYANAVGGEAPDGLENAGDGADDIQIYSDAACTIPVSSEPEQPSDVGSAVDDYLQYYESGFGAVPYFIKPSMDNGNVFDDSCILFTASGDGVNDTVDLHEVNGTVHTDILGVGLDLNQSGGNWSKLGNSEDEIYSTEIVAGEYHVFTNATAPVDVRYYIDFFPTLAFIHNAGAGTDLSAAGGTTTIDVGKLAGIVPVELDNGTAFADTAPQVGCNIEATTESIANITSSSYALYLDTNKTYWLRFCDAASSLQYRTFSAKNTTGNETLDLALVKGAMDSNFATGANARIEVFDDIANLVGTTNNSVNDGVGINNTEAGTDYTVYFEVDGSQAAAPLTDSLYDADLVNDTALKITDNTTLVSWEIGMEYVDDTTAFAGGDSKTANFVNDLAGTIPTDVEEVLIVNTINDEIWSFGEVNGSGNYHIYARAHAANTEYRLLDTSGGRIVLSKSIGALPDDTTFDAAKVIGDIDAGFFDGTQDTENVAIIDDYTDLTPTNYSSIFFLTDGTPDTYEVYFEVSNAGNASRDIRFVASDDKVSFINDFTDNSTAGSWGVTGGDNNNLLDPGESLDFILNDTITGTVPNDVDAVELRDDDAFGADGEYSISIGIPDVAGDYILYTNTGWDTEVLKTGAAGDDFVVVAVKSGTGDVYRQDDNANLASALPANVNVVKIRGSVPGDVLPELNGGNVLARDGAGDGCAVPVDETAGESNATIIGVGLVDTYEIYFKASTGLYLTFCDSAGNVEYVSTDTGENNFPANGSTTETLNLAAVRGAMDSDFAVGVNANMEVYDDFDGTAGVNLVGTTLKSINDGAGIGKSGTPGIQDYIVYFEVSGTKSEVPTGLNDSSYDLDGIYDVALKITDNESNVSWEPGMEMVDDTTQFVAGDSKTVDFINDLDGAVPNDVGAFVQIYDPPSGDVWTIGPVTAGLYHIYTTAHAVNTKYSLFNGTTTVLIKLIGTMPDDTTFDVAKLSGDIGSTFRNDTTAGTIDIFDDWNNNVPVTQYNSVSFTTDGGVGVDSYEVYFETPGGALVGTEDIKVTDYQGYVSWIMNLTSAVWPTGPGAIVAGNSSTFDLDPTLNGSTPTLITWIEVWGTGAATQYAVGIPSSNTYLMYVPQINDAGTIQLGAYTGPVGAGTLELDQTSGSPLLSLWGAGYNETFDVGEVTGNAHADMQDGLGNVQVYAVTGCLGLLSSELENATGGSYTQYFESTGSTGPFYIEITDNTGNYTTCGNKGFSFNGVQTRTGYNMSRTVSGWTPSSTYDTSTWGGSPADTDIDSIGADVDAGVGDDFTTSPVSTGAAAPDYYMMFVDSDEPGLSTTNLVFYGRNTWSGPTGTEFDKVIELNSDNTLNVAKVAGLADWGLWGGELRVCNSIPSLVDWGNCTTYLDSVPVTPVNGSLTTLDFDLFFEQPSTGDYYIELRSSGGYFGPSLYTYHLITTTQPGDYRYQDFDGVVLGQVTEAYDGVTPIENVTINMYENTNTTNLVRAYTNAGGYYEIYSGGSSGPMFVGEPAMLPYGTIYDMSFQKIGYITRDWSTDPNTFNMTDTSTALDDFGINGPVYPLGGAIGPDYLSLSLFSGVIVNVTDLGGNPIDDATVSVYTCLNSNPATCTTIGNCTNPVGDCIKYAADNLTVHGQYFFTGIEPGTPVQIRVSRAPFDTQFDPDPNATVNTNQAGGGTFPALIKHVGLINSPPECDLEYYIMDQLTDQQKEVGRNGDDVFFLLNCGEAGLNATIDASLIDNANTTYPDNMTPTLAGAYEYILQISTVGSGLAPVMFTASDGVNNYDGVVDVSIDNIAPLVLPGSSGPSGTQNTRSVIIYAATDEDAECRYSTAPGTDFSDMTNVMAGELTEHEAMVLATNNFTNNYYIRCQDTVGNAMTSDENILFYVDAVAPTVINSTPSSGLYNAATLPLAGGITITTDMDADCNWAPYDANYSNMPGANTFSTTANTPTAFGAPVEGNNMIYVRCKSTGGSAIEMSSSALIAFGYDTTPPTYELVSVSSDGNGWSSGGERYAKLNDTITVKFKASEELSANPTVTIGSGEMDYKNLTGGIYSYTRTLNGSENMSAVIEISGTWDMAGNDDVDFSDNGANAEFDFDAPGMTALLPATTQNSRSFLVSVNATDTSSLICEFDTHDVSFDLMANYLTEIGGGVYEGTAIVPSDGTNYTIYFACRDYAGNLAYTNIGPFTVDSTAPTVTYAWPNGGTYNAPQQIEVVTDSNAYCRYSTSDISYSSMGNDFTGGENETDHTVTPTPGSDGLIHYYVRCIDDVAGNEMSSSVLVYYTYDTTPPTYEIVTVSSDGNGMIIGGQLYANAGDTITVKFEGSEPIIGWPTVTIGSQDMTNVSYLGGKFIYTRQLNGSELGEAIAIIGGADAAGNPATTYGDVGVYLEVDFDAPTLYDPLPNTTQTSKLFTVSVSAGEIFFACKFDTNNAGFDQMANSMTDLLTGTYEGTAVVPSDGPYTIYFGCRDRAGNENYTSTSFDVDSTPPTITFNTNIYGPYNADPGAVIDVDFADAASNLDTASYKIANGAWTVIIAGIGATTYNTDWGVDWSSLSEGVNTIYVKVTDVAGNERIGSETVVVMKDTAAPTVMIVSPITGIVTGPDTTLAVLTNENANCEYNLDGAGYVNMTTTGGMMHFEDSALTGLSGTTHSVSVECSDSLGNGPTTKSVTWTVDRTGPQVVLAVLDPYYTDGITNLYANISSPNSVLVGAEYFIDTPGADGTGTALGAEDGSWDETSEDITAAIDLSALSDGEHMVIVHAQNANGWGPFYIGYGSFARLDTTPPTVEVTWPEDGSTTSDTTPWIEFWMDGTGSNIDFGTLEVLDGIGDPIPGFDPNVDCWNQGGYTYYCEFVPTTPFADPSSVTVTVNVDDAVGNSGTDSISFDVDSNDYIDLTGLSADKSTATTSGTDYWEYTMTMTIGSTAGDSVRIKLDDWTMTGTSNIIPVDGYATMTYTNASGSTKTYNIKNDYDLSQTVDAFRDEGGAPGIQATVKIRQVIPTSTIAGSYYTAYGIRSYWSSPP